QLSIPLIGSLAVMLSLFILAMGYTNPPLKLSYRGMGELDVGLTHSLGVILCGYIFQNGLPGDAFPWLLSVPLFLSIIPSILLAGFPDYNRSEEHTSELQSRENLVCRLLLEKKNSEY